jgi:hypothetical protein
MSRVELKEKRRKWDGDFIELVTLFNDRPNEAKAREVEEPYQLPDQTWLCRSDSMVDTSLS